MCEPQCLYGNKKAFPGYPHVRLIQKYLKPRRVSCYFVAAINQGVNRANALHCFRISSGRAHRFKGRIDFLWFARGAA
jgi:hypothetical protein